MPPRKRTIESPDNHSDASDELATSDREQRPKNLVKRRVSDIHHTPTHVALNDAGGEGDSEDDDFGSTHHKPPKKSIGDLNDDAAEKRRRRKSAKQSVSFIPPLDAAERESAKRARELDANAPDGGQGGSPDHKPLGHPKTPKPSALARASQLNLVAQTPAPAVPVDILSSKYEEWMKLATDNKINANNAWNFALIDYFQDMSLLRNELDNSINFQKASFTLDGCVKIWTSRVDSVGTETGKLLNNLADELRTAQGGQDPGDDEDNREGEPKSKKAKTHRAEATLAKSLSQLQVKKLDLEFTVDPLFKKTCADFDEGGAMGLLMNHLAVDENIRVVFDAGDSKLEGLEDETPDVEGLPVDLSEIQSKLPSVDGILTRTITESLASFHFSGDSAADFSMMHSFDHDNDGVNHPAFPEDGGDAEFRGEDVYIGDDDGFGAEDHDGPAEDFFTGEQAVQDDIAHAANFGSAGVLPQGGLGPVENFDPRRQANGRDLVMAMTEDGENMLDYFDTTVMKNWAGPQHWKLHRTIKRDSEGGPATRAKKEKVAFQIEFLEPPAHSSKELFAPASATSIALPSGTGAAAPALKGKRRNKKASARRDSHLLPDDMHFSSAQLLRLFRKPKFVLKMRRHGPGEAMHHGGVEDGEIDERFWAAAAQTQGGGEGLDGEENSGPIPFNTQFFHDDYDDGPGFEEEFVEGELAAGVGLRSLDEEDLMAATQGQLKRTRPEFVQYARRAKRVDVRKLKENIWKSLDIVVDHDDTKGPNMEDDQAGDDEAPTDPTEAREFRDVIDRLQTSYPQEKMDEISTSFCFICLLHLANEQGLKLEINSRRGPVDEIAEDETDETEVQAQTGDLWGLKVFRDPYATPSA